VKKGLWKPLVLSFTFPYTMLSTIRNEPISGIYILFALFQFPLYSLVFLKYKRNKPVLVALLAFHTLFVGLAFKYSGPLFA